MIANVLETDAGLRLFVSWEKIGKDVVYEHWHDIFTVVTAVVPGEGFFGTILDGHVTADQLNAAQLCRWPVFGNSREMIMERALAWYTATFADREVQEEQPAIPEQPKLQPLAPPKTRKDWAPIMTPIRHPKVKEKWTSRRTVERSLAAQSWMLVYRATGACVLVGDRPFIGTTLRAELSTHWDVQTLQTSKPVLCDGDLLCSDAVVASVMHGTSSDLVSLLVDELNEAAARSLATDGDLLEIGDSDAEEVNAED